MMARASSGLTLVALALVVLLGARPAHAQSVAANAPPRAAPTTPVWTVAPDMSPQTGAPQRTSKPPRYAVMADAPPQQPAAAPPQAPAAVPPPPRRGRYSVSNPPPDLRKAAPRAVRRGRDDAYVLGPGDKLRVTVYGEADLSGEFDVDSTGDVRMPLIGQVHAGGRTVHAFEERVTRKLAGRYLLHPQVSAEVTAYRPFFIIGEVNKPGQYPYVNGMNVVTAVALAGGYTYRADEDDVYVRRDGATREVERPADATTKVHPGDVVRVTERFF